METKYVEAQITEYLHTKAARSHTPLNGTFELTPVCNMSCKMCYVRMTKVQQENIRPLRTAEEWLKLAEIAKEKGLLYILLTGGEPFLHPQMKEIMEGLHKLGLVISINSNGTLITKEVVEWMKNCPPSRINITLYGATNETYGRLCGNPNGFTQVTNAIHLLKEAGILVKINCSLTPYNVCDLEKIKEFCDKEELNWTPTSYMFPPLRRDLDSVGLNDRFTPEDAARYSAKIEYLNNGKEKFLKHVSESDFAGMCGEVEEDCHAIEGEKIHCRAGKCSFWVTWDGRFLPCGMFPGTNAKNVFDSDFDLLWDEMQSEVDAIRLPAECTECSSKEYCRVCAAMTITETGHYNQVPKYRCAMSKFYPIAMQELAAQLVNGDEEAK